jgi:hypothetical protein
METLSEGFSDQRSWGGVVAARPLVHLPHEHPSLLDRGVLLEDACRALRASRLALTCSSGRISLMM